MSVTVIGRDREIRELNELYNSGKAESVAVYVRRRVGKTFLVDEVLESKISFRHAGLSPIVQEQEARKKENPRARVSLMKLQLKHFYMSLLKHGMKKSHLPTSWLEAFYMLEELVEKLPEFVVDKAYHKTMVNRQNILERELPRNMVEHPTLVGKGLCARS